MRSFLSSAHPLRRLATLALLVLFTGCLTIEEHYTFKKNGSGTMEYVIDMSAMAELMKSLDKMTKEEKGEKEGMEGLELTDKLDQLKAVKGLKKVKLKKEKDGFVQRISFAFADLSALNGALNVLMPDSTGVQQEFFHWEGNTLVRRNNRHANELGGDMGSSGGGTDSMDLGGMLQSMQYKYSFAFANDVTGTEQVEGMVKETPSSRKVDLSTDWSVIMKDPHALDLRITLDK